MQKDKKKALLWIIGYIIVALIFHFAWGNLIFTNYHNFVFAAVDVILWASLAIFGAWWYKDAEREYYLWLPYLVFGIAVALVVWSASWAVAIKDRVTAPVKTEQIDTALLNHSQIQTSEKSSTILVIGGTSPIGSSLGDQRFAKMLHKYFNKANRK